jgi:ketosteroid isomerase-like protein
MTTSQQNLDLITRGYQAFASGNREAVLSLLQPDVVVEVHTDRPDIGRAVYRGHDGFLANFAEIEDVFEDLVIEAGDVTEHGNRLMVATRVSGRGKGSGVAIEARIFHVWTLRDGLAARLEIFSDEDQARAAMTV